MRIRLVAASALLLASSSALLADEGDPTFSIKEREASPGTLIKRDMIVSRRLPINKGYGEMTPDQQAIIRDWYEHLEPDDEPPYPLHGMEQVYRRIGEAQQKLGVTGTLRLDVKIDAAGVANAVTVLATPDPVITQFVAAVLMNETYKPALCAGRPCTMSLPLVFDFTMRS